MRQQIVIGFTQRFVTSKRMTDFAFSVFSTLWADPDRFGNTENFCNFAKALS